MVIAEHKPIKTLYTYLQFARGTAERMKETEVLYQRTDHVEKPWGIYNSDSFSYSRIFKPLLPEGIDNFLEARQQTKPQVIGDIMGQGLYVKPELRSASFGVTLADLRTAEEKQRDTANGDFVMGGNLLYNSTWTQLKSVVMEKTGQDTFTFLTCRPVLGWETLFGKKFSLKDKYSKIVWEDAATWSITARMIRLLDTNGVLLVDYQYLSQAAMVCERVKNKYPDIQPTRYGGLARFDKVA